MPDEVNQDYLRKFVAFINRNRSRWRFIIVVGGGKTCRNYQNTARRAGVKNPAFLDWVGIMATRLNAELLRSVFGPLAEDRVVIDPTKKFRFKKSVMIAAGYKPGWSTDFDAALLAKNYGAKRIINLSNIDSVYNKDPKKHRDAAPVKSATWKEFFKIIGTKWNPGDNLPFDPVASNLAQKEGMEVIIANGWNLKNLQNILDAKKFRGTRIF